MHNLDFFLKSLGLLRESERLPEDGIQHLYRKSDFCVIKGHSEEDSLVKREYQGVCNVDLSGDSFWIGVESADKLFLGHPVPVVVSYYTEGTQYETHAKELISTLEAIGGIPYLVVGVEDAGSWELNCSLKPAFIENCLNELKCPVLWVDADARLSARPSVPDIFDFAIHRFAGWEFASGTVYFGYSQRALTLVRRWKELCQRRPLIWDQMLLDQAWSSQVNDGGLVTGWLPESYTHVFDVKPPGLFAAEPVVTHYQASRREMKRPKPEIPPTIVAARSQALPNFYEYDVPKITAVGDRTFPVSCWPGVVTDFGRLLDYIHSVRSSVGQDASFIQVGAMDGVKFDPIHERICSQGWTGVLLEPLPDIFEKLKETYSGFDRLSLVNAAIDCVSGTREMYRIPQKLVDEGVLPEWALGISSFYNDRNALGGNKIDGDLRELVRSSTISQSVSCLTFDQIILEYGFEALDLLQIDTEGHDWMILQTFPINRIRPEIINFEYYNLPEVEVREALKWLEVHGYAYSMDHKDVTATILRL